MRTENWRSMMLAAGIGMTVRQAPDNPAMFGEPGVEGAEKHWICVFSSPDGAEVEVPFSTAAMGEVPPHQDMVVACVAEDVRLCVEAGSSEALATILGIDDGRDMSRLADVYDRVVSTGDRLSRLFAASAPDLSASSSPI